MKIDLLVGANLYGTVVHFSKSLRDALERFGVETRLFWVGEGHFFHALYAIAADPPDLTCSFSDISLEGTSLGDLWHIPHVSLLVDPPIYFLHQLTSRLGWISCVDQKDCTFVHNLGFSKVFFLPHAADALLKTPVDKSRPYDAVFFGSCIDYEEIACNWPATEKELLYTAADLVLSDSGLSIAEALLQLGTAPSDLPRLHGEVDSYTRGKDRVELIRSVKGCTVTIWGEGPWEKYLPGYQIFPALSFDQVLEKMKECKVVLNSSPRFKNGAHERIFYALMCGASVYTGHNSYLSAILPEVSIYTYGKWQSFELTQWKERAQSGQAKVLAAHTWDARSKQLIDYLSEFS